MQPTQTQSVIITESNGLVASEINIPTTDGNILGDYAYPAAD